MATIAELRVELQEAIERVRMRQGVPVETNLNSEVQNALVALSDDPFNAEAMSEVWKAFSRQISGDGGRDEKVSLKSALAKAIARRGGN